MLLLALCVRQPRVALDLLWRAVQFSDNLVPPAVVDRLVLRHGVDNFEQLHTGLERAAVI